MNLLNRLRRFLLLNRISKKSQGTGSAVSVVNVDDSNGIPYSINSSGRDQSIAGFVRDHKDDIKELLS